MNTHALVCNEVDGTPTVRPGALCYVRQYSTETVSVLVDVMNQDGVWVSLWRPFASLTNFRTKFLPAKHPKIIWAQPKVAANAKLSALVGAFAVKEPGVDESPAEGDKDADR